MEILDNIPINLEREKIIERLRLDHRGKQIVEMVQELIDVVVSIARPKAVYKVSYVDNNNGDSLDIDGIQFSSRVLCANLNNVQRVFPYIATCGTELYGVPTPSEDVLRAFYLDTIKTVVLGIAINYFADHVKQKYMLGQMSHMNPGSLKDWPITQQRELFSLFSDVEGLIGVRLTQDYVMRPLRSSSGIYFPTEIMFESCQLCPREKCIGRRAPYDSNLVRKYLGEDAVPQH